MTKAKIMGILNVTPDSFSDGGCWTTPNTAIERALQMCQEGADIIDVGGESTRPGAESISVEEELRRVIPVIQGIKAKNPIPISIDTSKPAVAAAAIEAGASYVNDVTGCADPAMQEVVRSTGVPICVMHMLGTPRTMQINPHYEEGVIEAIMSWFSKRLDTLLKAGLRREQIILDPGIGFGKTVADNVKIIHNLPRFRSLGFPLLLGVSRKSFLQKILSRTPQQVLAATVAANTLALQGGVDIIRVHDVAPHRDVVDFFTATQLFEKE